VNASPFRKTSKHLFTRYRTRFRIHYEHNTQTPRCPVHSCRVTVQDLVQLLVGPRRNTCFLRNSPHPAIPSPPRRCGRSIPMHITARSAREPADSVNSPASFLPADTSMSSGRTRTASESSRPAPVAYPPDVESDVGKSDLPSDHIRDNGVTLAPSVLPSVLRAYLNQFLAALRRCQIRVQMRIHANFTRFA